MTTTYSSLHAVVDKTMKGIDAEGSFDPTEGDNPALARNNLGEVWNQQVSSVYIVRCQFFVPSRGSYCYYLCWFVAAFIEFGLKTSHPSYYSSCASLQTQPSLFSF